MQAKKAMLLSYSVLNLKDYANFIFFKWQTFKFPLRDPKQTGNNPRFFFKIKFHNRHIIFAKAFF